MNWCQKLSTKPQSCGGAFNWLLRSGIQDNSEDLAYRGGINAWFDLRDQSYPFISSEITGYAVNAFLFYHRLSCHPEYLRAAQMAADWLTRYADPSCGLVTTRLNHSYFDLPYYTSYVFTFDEWIIAYSLACMAEVSGNDYYLKKATQIADSILEKTVREDGFFYPMFNIVDRTAAAANDKWSRQAGSFHAKALLGLKKLESLTGNKQYRTYALRILTRTLEVQQTDGRFISQDNDRSTHLHPHLYTLEGILSFGLAEGNYTCIAAAEKGLRWVLDHQSEDGVCYCFFVNDRFLPYVRVDVLAQTLRLGLILLNIGLLNCYRKHLELLYNKLITFQITYGLQKGGFLYGQEENGCIHYHVNSWATMFAAQALALFEYFKPSQNRYYNMSFFV